MHHGVALGKQESDVRMGRLIASLALALVMMAAVAWAESVSFPHSTLDVVGADGRHHPFSVELASSPAQLSQGLMFRRSLAIDSGMLFDFGSPRQVAMWMKNTLIPLDMLFMDRDGRVIFIEEFAVPGTLQPRGPSDPVRAVLEVAGGTARRLGLKPGDRVEHPLFAH